MKDRCPTCGKECISIAAKVPGSTGHYIVVSKCCRTAIYDPYFKEKPMNEWKELEIDNLPPDVLTGDYEVQFMYEDPEKDSWATLNVEHLVEAKEYEHKSHYRYRRKEKPVPSHPEIMTKWWEINSGKWEKVCSFSQKDNVYIFNDFGRMLHTLREWFSDANSADIPPEK